MGHRIGTAVAEYSQLVSLLGEPVIYGPYRDYEYNNNKVTCAFSVNTPRGKCEVRDYWWNGANEWSIAAESRKAALWAARLLRRNGIAASTLFHYGKDAKLFVSAQEQ